VNNNNEKVNEVGQDLIVHGVSYKLFYFDEGKGDIPKYAIIPGTELFPVYDFQIEPQLICAIRFYVQEDIVDKTKTKTIIEVYYEKRFMKFEELGEKISITIQNSVSDILTLVEDTVHGFEVVPLVVYGDNLQLGIFDPIKKIIDGIDTITSTDLDEIEKFALAYLILTGMTMDQTDVDAAKEKRLFELDVEAKMEYLTKEINNEKMEYLTKEINNEFNGSVLEFLVSEVHKQSGVPDFASKDFAAESGIALQYKLMGFENLASSIEYLFKKGEQDSIDIINSVVFNVNDRFKFLLDNPDKMVKITMTRTIGSIYRDNF
jgi:SPP1 family phage portal protein